MFDRQQLTVYCLVVTPTQLSDPYSNLNYESIPFAITIATFDNKYADNRYQSTCYSFRHN